MFLNELILWIVGLICGMAVATGTFAFLLVIGVVPRIMRTARLLGKYISVETAIIIGVIVGNGMSLWERAKSAEQVNGILGYGGHTLLGLYGLSAGIFVGCIAVALAEILDTFPIMFRRIGLDGRMHPKAAPQLKWVLLAMAAGKLVGSLFYFVLGYTGTA